jgi:hypothetical protein
VGEKSPITPNLDDFLQSGLCNLLMTQAIKPRPIRLLTLLATHHRKVAWQLSLGASLLLLAASAYVSALPGGAAVLGLAGLVALGLGTRNLLPLLKHDLPLLREGVPVIARVVAPVCKDERQSLYHISYRLPSERAERDGVFAASREKSFHSGEQLLVMVNRQDPSQLLEVTGQYEQLMHPVLEKEYA